MLNFHIIYIFLAHYWLLTQFRGKSNKGEKMEAHTRNGIKMVYAMYNIKELRDLLKYAEQKSKFLHCGIIIPCSTITINFAISEQNFDLSDGTAQINEIKRM